MNLHALGLLAPLTFFLVPQDAPNPQEARFPASTALAQAVDPAALSRLDQLVQSFVDEEAIVGGELLVIKNGRTILHEAYGLNDVEAEKPLETGSVFCVRSMTKPLIGTSILMLVDDKKLKLDDPVSQYLPCFDLEDKRAITVEQLLTHTSGLTMSTLLAVDLSEIGNIQEVAAMGAPTELEFDPGTDFNYSDQGTDTLTALIEVVSGMPAAQFVQTRVLDPLGMQDSACVMTEGHPLRARGVSKYMGTEGRWSRFWSPSEPPLFPFFLGSQGMYSTLEDYARFTDFWLRKGRVGKKRLLGARYMRKALEPGAHDFPGPTSLPNLEAGYGSLMQLWMGPGKADDDERELVAFGHTGSDGTHAWVFPEQKAMVLYFTQSRGTMTGLRVEEALGELFLGAPYNPNQAAPPFEEYLGYYYEGEGDAYRAIIRDGDHLALEILGRAVVPLVYVGDDRWKMKPNPSNVIAFDRDENGTVTGYHVGDHQEFRFEPSDELPSAVEVIELVMKTHRMDRIESLGPIRMHSTITIDKLNLSGTQKTTLAWPNLFRVDAEVADNSERVGYDGEHVWYGSHATERTQLEGARAAKTRLDHYLAILGDWRQWHDHVEVIQRMDSDERGAVVLVRMGDTSATATTLAIELETGHVVQSAGMAYPEGAGRIGVRAEFSEYKEVSGIVLPHRTEVSLANSMAGSIMTEITEVELGVEVPKGAFDLTDTDSEDTDSEDTDSEDTDSEDGDSEDGDSEDDDSKGR